MVNFADFDILIVGSGPSGVHAAQESLKHGYKVALVEIGFIDDKYQKLIPPLSFSEIRKTDLNQVTYFLGEDPAKAFQSQAKAGAHLTPPRQHMIQDMEKIFPIESESFLPLQSTACGGLGVSWGSNVFTLEDFELRRIGLPPHEMRKFYKQTSEDVGVSGTPDDALAPLISKHLEIQPPLQLDTNSKKIYENYRKNIEKFMGDGFYLGQSLLAILSQAKKDRRPNPYWDMDFWSDLSKSVYRPLFTLEELKKNPNFFHIPHKIAVRFEETNTKPTEGSFVSLFFRDLNSGQFETIRAKKLLLAAGAINSGKLAYSSLGFYDMPMPILCNPNHWVAAINWPMLGRSAVDTRYSLAQLTALLRVPEDPEDYVLGQFYSYRSLLYSRLLHNIPLPPSLGLIFLRFLITSFTCVNIHFSDSPSSRKWLKVIKRGDQDILKASYERTVTEETFIRKNERRFLKKLLALKCIPIGVNRPAHGASIHYAGTLPFNDENKPLTCTPEGQLRGAQNVYVADGASWKFLSAKGLTFTLMAGAKRVAQEAIRALKTAAD